MAQTDRDDATFADDDNLTGLTEFPPEEPLAVDERLTPVEEQAGERFERRVAHREDHDDDRPEPDRVGTLVAPGGGLGFDDEGDEVAMETRGADPTLWETALELEGTVPAEEAAMHLTEPPPMDDSDGYLDGD